MRIWRWLAAGLLLSSCGQVQVTDYRGSHPEFDLLGYFDGPLQAYGMVQDYTGQVVRRFTVSLCGYHRDGLRYLDEDFVYDDGETQFRQWRIERRDDRYIGRADDIVGQATGQAQGFALNWRYTMDLQVGGDRYRVQFDDWMYRLSDRHLFNRARIKKFGLTLAEVTLFFDKREGRCQPARRA